jgi:phosphoglycolate phosphatase-like HAD superfamily hydrolase
MEPVTHVLWDLDGTLVRNVAGAGSLYHEAIELAAGRDIAERVANQHGATDALVLHEMIAHHQLDPKLRGAATAYLEELSRLRWQKGEVREACPGIPEALAAVSAAGHTNALLTGNGRERARYKLLSASLDVDAFDWTHSYFGDRTLIRSDLAKRAAAELEDPIIVGDTPRDGDAAFVSRLRFLAVATGAFPAEELGAHAVTVVADMVDGLPVLLELL